MKSDPQDDLVVLERMMVACLGASDPPDDTQYVRRWFAAAGITNMQDFLILGDDDFPAVDVTDEHGNRMGMPLPLLKRMRMVKRFWYSIDENERSDSVWAVVGEPDFLQYMVESEKEEAEAAAGEVEPEVIGRKEESEEE